jgi:hypothetical protein
MSQSGELDQMLRLAVDVRTRVQEQTRVLGRGKDRTDGWAGDPWERAENEQ